ncbi:X-linked retinitis pigmentosa GTPase regulator-interacting protein 1 [Zootoca vivipara]|uniref:X-linked retinitis pigmentosa GTPase regulator-interacting protein 1 n=1 Tax=Zootoca vivipara TaxID=8524 RepID=UPI00293B8D00|nr:X-linked retinitis pigmentosa GTPase regulator-interacting protein 1 [Zootoca vivipara]
MSLLVLDETTGDLPVRDTSQKPSVIAAIQDVSSSAVLPAKSQGLKTWMKASGSLARTRRQINRVNRTELEDGFLRLHDENLLLKEFARKQEDRIKRMGTKLSRLSHERMQVDGRPGSWIRSSGRNLDLEEDLEGTRERVRELERRNEGLQNRLLFYKQQLQLQSLSRHGPYGYVSPRVDTGLRRAHTAAGRVPEKLRKGMRVQGPAARPTHTAPARYGDHTLEGSRVETERLTQSLVLAALELDPESMSSTRGRDTDPESGRSLQRHLEVRERRAAIQENVELIRLQKLLRAKNSELVVTKAQFAGLQEAYETQLQQNQEALRSASEALLAQVEKLNAHLREESQKVTALESQVEVLSPLQGMLEDFQERVRDLEKERDLLKEDYDKLLESCLSNTQHPLDVVPQKDNAPCLEEQLSSAIEEKQKLQEQLEKERALNEELKQEVSQLLEERPQEVGFSREKAAILENQTREEDTPSSLVVEPLYVEGLERDPGKEEMFAQRSLKRRLHETEAAHAETVLELEKTRDMLILQHRINRDYQAELDGVLLQTAREKQEHEEKEQQMARLLDLRGARIRQLEGRHVDGHLPTHAIDRKHSLDLHKGESVQTRVNKMIKAQLKDVAYGTRAAPFPPREGDPSAEAVPDQAPQLRRGENLFELHISGAVLSAEALRLLGDPEPLTFCTYSFYDFETHCTPVVRGSRARYDFTSQYVVQAEPFFLQYLQGATSRLDLHLASAVEHTTLASCWLRFGEVLGSGEKVHATAVLRGSNGEDFGILEYWARLRFPIEQILRLHRQRTKALGYLSAGVQHTMVEEEKQALGAGWNEVCVRIEGCSSLRSRWLGSQPSPYAMYRFFTFPDHDTITIPSSNNPHFGDAQSFALRITPELHHYLLWDSLQVYVFDDEDEEAGSYLGKAQIPLLPLAQGCSVAGDFVLMDPAGKPNGSIRLRLEWKLLYMPPEDFRHQASADWEQQRQSLEQQIEEEKAELRSRVCKVSVKDQSWLPRFAVPLAVTEQVLRESGSDRLPSSLQRKKPRLCMSEAEKRIRKHARPENGAIQQVALEGGREEEEHKAAAVEEEMMTASHQELEAKSRPLAEAAVLSDNASERPDTSSEAQTTESDEVVVQSSGLQESLGPPSDRIRVEVISLSLHPDSPPIADENIQQLYVEYRFPGLLLEETETPFSLRKPQGNQEIYFHFSKVIKVDPDPESLQRQLLFSMLDAEEPQHNWLQFAVVSEPLPGTGGECEDVGFASLDMREILLTGSDMLERELDVISPFDPDANIGKLKVSMEAASALRAIYWAGKRKSSEE